MFIAACGLSLVAASEGCSPVAVCGLLVVASLVVEHTQAVGVWLQQLKHMGSVVAMRPVGS